jgi:hypothetical protein
VSGGRRPAEGRLGAEHKQRQATLAVIDLFDIVAQLHRAKSRLAELARTAAVGAARGSRARRSAVLTSDVTACSPLVH